MLGLAAVLCKLLRITVTMFLDTDTTRHSVLHPLFSRKNCTYLPTLTSSEPLWPGLIALINLVRACLTPYAAFRVGNISENWGEFPNHSSYDDEPLNPVQQLLP
jgi:hypothetical protein